MKEEEKDLLSIEQEQQDGHPLFRLDRFLFKALASLILVLAVAIMFKQSSSPSLEGQAWMKEVMEKEFQFSKAAEWYEKTLGEPLPFTVDGWTEKEKVVNEQAEYAVPVSGKVIEDFQTNGRGLMVEAGLNEGVKAIKDGTVLFVGQKEEFGQTVIVQHADNSESWYGHVANPSVQPYEKVAAGSVLAQLAPNEQTFYLAIKKDGIFVDPGSVISFE
ncbi:M23 family metallopeptidase [Bacillus sp. FJAT-42315]|uniref:M23 family metallopeptidase n=1 Tax=Bacillus sp. FJAT-42315 TaxID=2014077 RepID=UPI000C24E3BE|nr:M23 family metallopeptidase [Bacillus sp. FJAT-42315]